MRIALVNRNFCPKGGGERYAMELALELAAQGHELHLFGSEFADLSFAAKTYPIKTLSHKPGWLRMLSFRRAAAKALAKNRFAYDVSYALTQVYPTDAAFLGGGVNKFWLQTRFESKWWRRIYPILNGNQLAQNYLESKICHGQHCKKLIVNSHLVKRHAIELGGALPGVVEVVHNGIDVSRFNFAVRDRFRDATRRLLALPHEGLAIAYASANWERKGLKTIFSALGLLPKEVRSRFYLLIAGNGDPKKFLTIAHKNGVEENHLRFLGFVEAPEKVYAASDLSILPTQYDPCASVVLEALACGLPTVSTAQNGASELIRENETGFVLPTFDDAETLAKHLTVLLDDRRREQMATAAAESMRAQTFARVATQTVEILQNL